VISKSDFVILVVASGALAVGVFRWHQNTQDVSAVTIPASSRVIVDPSQRNTLPAANTVKTVTATTQTGANTQILNSETSVGQNIAIENGTVANNAAEVTVRTVAKAQPVVEVIVGSTAASNESINLGKHRVRSGDYLGKIARQYGTDVNTLRELNSINGSIIQIGQEILYPL